MLSEVIIMVVGCLDTVRARINCRGPICPRVRTDVNDTC
jgi:hypothetical protein